MVEVVIPLLCFSLAALFGYVGETMVAEIRTVRASIGPAPAARMTLWLALGVLVLVAAATASWLIA